MQSRWMRLLILNSLWREEMEEDTPVLTGVVDASIFLQDSSSMWRSRLALIPICFISCFVAFPRFKLKLSEADFQPGLT